ncbi:MAG TPA: hypothetical protein VE359_24395 [Vicinamibacteria bacterium]|nr:hypothetical protein [Vicinamibacteria bacterium]
MEIDPTECRTWAQQSKAAWEVTPLVEMERGSQVQVGFELSLYARVPTDVPPGSERDAAFEALWDRLRGIAESLVPLAGKDARIEVDPFEAAARLRPETQFAPEILLSARLFHGSDLLAPMKPGERELLRPLEDRLHELGLKPRSW